MSSATTGQVSPTSGQPHELQNVPSHESNELDVEEAGTGKRKLSEHQLINNG